MAIYRLIELAAPYADLLVHDLLLGKGTVAREHKSPEYHKIK